MNQATYRAHLAGSDWQAIHADVIERANYRCEECGSPYGLQVHHASYERVGNEQPDDLVCLCRDCHRAAHGLGQGAARSEAKKLASPHEGRYTS